MAALDLCRKGNNMAYTYFDIETIPDQSENALEIALQGIKAPANYKDKEKIEEYKKEKAQDALDKTALDGFKGHVCCIGVNDEVYSVRDIKDERDALKWLFAMLDGHTLVGHNIIGFDIPFLTKRAFVLDVRLPVDFYWPRNPKPWDSNVFDTMMRFGNGKDYVSLDSLCRLASVEGKKDIDGSMVSGLWKSGLHDAIAEYCKDDVKRVRAVHERFLSIGW